MRTFKAGISAKIPDNIVIPEQNFGLKSGLKTSETSPPKISINIDNINISIVFYLPVN